MIVMVFAGGAKLARRQGPDTQKAWDGGLERPVLRDLEGSWPERQHYDPTSDVHRRAGLPGDLTEPIRVHGKCLGERYDDVFGWCECAKEDTASLAVPATYISHNSHGPLRAIAPD
jgi:hypothetical protein